VLNVFSESLETIRNNFSNKNITSEDDFHSLIFVEVQFKVEIIAVEEFSTSIQWKNIEEDSNAFRADVGPFTYTLLQVLLVDIRSNERLCLSFILWLHHQQLKILLKHHILEIMNPVELSISK